MGDGWETKRSRQLGHKDFAVIKLYAVVVCFEVLRNHGLVPRERLLEVGKRVTRNAKRRILDVVRELIESARRM